MSSIRDSIDEAPEGPGQELTTLLHARGQRATPQRLVILRELRRRGRHATADELRRSISAELPGTSIPTVYATLDLLVELGLARRIDAGGGPALYDPRVDPHHHMVCRRCGSVEDLDRIVDDVPLLRAASRRGFAGQDVDVVVSGLCSSCAER